MTAIKAIAPIVVIFIAIVLSLAKYDIMSLNKPYCVSVQHIYTQPNARIDGSLGKRRDRKTRACVFLIECEQEEY